MRRPFSWKEHRLRAQQLTKERLHAAELLAFYASLLELQEELYGRVRTATWFDAVRGDEGAHPRIRLDRLPIDELLPGFRRFVADLRAIATDVLASIGRSLEASSRTAQTQLLRDFLTGESPDNLPTTFFPRAYLQPLARALAERCEPVLGNEVIATCPLCGWAPHISVIRDQPEIKGQRLLICSLCAYWWPARRSSCARCRETRADKLIYHESETMDYIRVEECASCHTYVKTVDLRRNGVAVPEVDDVGSVELDLWAQQRGLSRIHRNVLGL